MQNLTISTTAAFNTGDVPYGARYLRAFEGLCRRVRTNAVPHNAARCRIVPAGAQNTLVAGWGVVACDWSEKQAQKVHGEVLKGSRGPLGVLSSAFGIRLDAFGLISLEADEAAEIWAVGNFDLFSMACVDRKFRGRLIVVSKYCNGAITRRWASG